jgi:flagellar hook assembly protein FlgD
MVEIDILDINGKLIKRLVQQTKPDGRHQIDWDGTDKFARPVATGMYLIVMEAGGKAMMRKIMYIK